MPDRSGMEFYIKDQTTGENLQIPVNPSDVKLKYETDDHSETIVNLGEVNIPGKLKLVGVSINSIFPTVGAHYVATKSPHKQATYVKKIKSMQSKNHKVRFVVTKTDISMLMTIASFEYGLENGWADEYAYTLDLKQYRKFSYEKKKNPKKRGRSKKGKKRTKPAKKINVGSTVSVNGRLHADSYGKGAGMYEKNAKREVLYIVPGRKYPVCVGINGKARGWVKMSEVKRS